MAGTSQATPKTFPVILHIYDASRFNPLLRVYSGFYRSAIEVHGVEYMFLDYIGDDGRVAGQLLIGNPSQYNTINKGLKLYQSIVVGRTYRNNVEAEQGVHLLPLDTLYDQINNNSHQFAGRVSELLVGNRNVFQSLEWVGQCNLPQNIYWFLKIKVRGNMLTASDQSKATFPVVLNVYKVPSNTIRRCFGFELSIYRSSVEVHGVEYMFCEHDGVAGITMTTPFRMSDEKELILSESIVMGRTDKQNADQIREAVETVGRAGGYGVYPRNVYDYISKNCHHFSEDLCNELVGKGIPGWIKRAAFYERNYTGEALTGREKIGRGMPQRWTDGNLFMTRNPPMDGWLVRKLNSRDPNEQIQV